ncbi:hypothetical protein V8G54_030405 [Vigna mungo]|uniref:Uncharacterized protein n=1 Tax=Vigna mungo TaxID=3915 RepID=A0AAQ3MWM0_VIGMU
MKLNAKYNILTTALFRTNKSKNKLVIHICRSCSLLPISKTGFYIGMLTFINACACCVIVALFLCKPLRLSYGKACNNKFTEDLNDILSSHHVLLSDNMLHLISSSSPHEQHHAEKC